MEAVGALEGQTHPRHFKGRKMSPWSGPAVTRLGEAVDLEMGRPRLQAGSQGWTDGSGGFGRVEAAVWLALAVSEWAQVQCWRGL